MNHSEKLYQKLAWLLKYGSLLAMTILFLGIIWSFILPDSERSLKTPDTENFLSNLLPDSPPNLLNLGIMVLMLMPVGVVLVCLVHYTSEKEKKYSLISLGVLLVLILGIFLGAIQV